MSGWRLRPEFDPWNAGKVFELSETEVPEPPECISALVLQGLKKPVDCTAFGTRCSPENPLGALMVSAEGACSAYFRYRRHLVAVS
jgi:hydrogenase expression/formation protein HypD